MYLLFEIPTYNDFQILYNNTVKFNMLILTNYNKSNILYLIKLKIIVQK